MQTTRHLRKTLDQIAGRNQDAALLVMRAAERCTDELQRQHLLKLVEQLNLDAVELRGVRASLDAKRA